ncbi:hypothetical protein [Thalassotalea sp. PLHSN55]|uniref:hypothetical protein n=1 Tax=Thalassotalea sp. PLHSN55 TaxID=3435888 RepID=UPI003F87CFA9
MRKSPSGSSGIKLTTVILAVFVLAVSALMSNASVAGDMEVTTEINKKEVV